MYMFCMMGTYINCLRWLKVRPQSGKWHEIVSGVEVTAVDKESVFAISGSKIIAWSVDSVPSAPDSEAGSELRFIVDDSCSCQFKESPVL
jgi:hypothetical protein